jgi:steroid delta-isomerase
MKRAMLAYVDAMNRGDLDEVLSLFASDAEVEDPVGSAIMKRADFAEFYRRGIAMKAKLTPVGPARGSHGSAAALAFIVRMESEGRMVSINSVDVATFDESGKIRTMKGYWGPEDANPE